MSLLVLMVVVAVLDCGQGGKIIQGQISSCKGVFDLYFVLDSSRSVRNHFHSDIVPFVQNVSRSFVNPNFRLCFITFATKSVLHMPLTRIDDRATIDAGMQSLAKHIPKGMTSLTPALDLVIEENNSVGGDTASIVLVLTDGIFSDFALSLQKATVLDKKGVIIFGIGVGENIRENQLISLAGDADQVFHESNIQDLDDLTEQIINKTCIEVKAVDPGHICIGSSQNLTIIGRGFNNSLNQSRSICRFLLEDGSTFVTHPTEPITNNRIVCADPKLNTTGDVLLQISLNGISFISSNVTYSLETCGYDDNGDNSENENENGNGKSQGYVAGIVVGILALIALLLLLIMVWFFFPLITATVCAKRPPKPKKMVCAKLPPKPKENNKDCKPPRKWDVVDASYYGGGGVGGIKPVTVHWGQSGATEEGNKLTAAKDANVVSVITKTNSSGRDTPQSGCFKTLKIKGKRMYVFMASIRPVKGSAREIVWCPRRKRSYAIHSNNSTLKTGDSTLFNRSRSYQERPQPNLMQQPNRPTDKPVPARPAPPRPAPPRIEAKNPLSLV